MSIIRSLVLLFTLCSLANANVYVLWGAPNGFYSSGGGLTSLFGIGSGESALAQLLWRPNNSGSVLGTGGAVFGATDYVSGGDVLLASYTLTEGVNCNEWGEFTAPLFDDGGARPLGGYVYARIFENNTPQVDDWYYVGPVIAASNLNPPPGGSDSPQSYYSQMNRDATDGFGDAIDGGFGAQVQPVPEPGTMALFALGVATLAASRRRRKNAAA